MFFGLGANSALLQPVMKPRPSCSVVHSEPEGNNYLTTIKIEFHRPLYLYLVPWSVSVLYEAKMEITNGWSFFEVQTSGDEGPLNVERLYDDHPDISKVLTYKHRIVSGKSYVLTVKVSGPSIVEGECPFLLSVRY